MKKKIALLLSFVLTGSLLAACGGTTNESTTAKPTNAGSETDAVDSTEPTEVTDITLWHLFGEADTPGNPHLYYVAWAEKFNEENENINVTVLGGKSTTDIQTAIAAGTTPDIFMNYWNNAPQWADAGALLDLTPYYESDSEFDYKDFMPGALSISNYNGKFYSVPNSYSTTFMFYRTDILEEAGWTEFPANTDELLEAIKDTTEANEDGSIKRLGILPNMPWLDTEMWEASFNANWMSEDGTTVTAADAANVEMFEFVASIYTFYEEEFGWDTLTINDFGDTVRGNRATANDPVLTGEVAMRWNSENLHAALTEHGSDIEWEMAWFPNKAGTTATALMTSNVWEINGKTENPDLAWQALADLAGKENMKVMSEGEFGNGSFSACRSAIEYVNSTLAAELGSAK